MSLKKFYKQLEIFERTDSDFAGVTYTKIDDYKGYIQPASATKIYKDGKNGENVEYIMFTDVSTPIKYANKIIQDSFEYVILYELGSGGVSNLGHHKEVTLGRFI